MITNCPIVGIGASAGGLSALKSFFDKTPADIGAAFVIIQHLDPNHQSLTAEILGRHTTMPAKQIKQGMTVEKNHVYVIPPNAYVTLRGNEFELGEAALRHSLRMPIDVFFSSLAAEQTQRAVGIVLSGTGSDGTAGIREIKASGGITFAQSPETAQFDGMPRAAIATGQIDVVCAVEDMPAHISEYLAHDYTKQASNSETAAATADDEGSLKSIIALLQAQLGHDFRGYKKGTLERRIARRMGLRNIQKLPDYLTYLREQEGEAKELYRDFLISVTSFFRDQEAFLALETSVIEKLVAEKGSDEAIRVWVPGCATGEEAYSIAMLLIEKLESVKKHCPIQIFATDLDEQALSIGRTGMYSASLMADMPRDRLDRFFIKNDGSYRVNKELRESVTFASQNVITDPPFSKLDLVSCRNLLIYLDGNLQDKIIGYFHFALRDEGFLFLGRSESINQLAGLFEPVDKNARIFRRLANSQVSVASFPIKAVTSRAMSNSVLPATRPKETVRMREMMQQQLLRSYAPAAVLTNAKHQVLYFMGPTARYLEQPSGIPTQNLINLVHAELRKNLRTGLKRAIETTEQVIIENISVQLGRNRKNTKISIRPVTAPGEGDPLFLVTFEDIAAPEADKVSTAGSPEPEAEEATVDELESKLRDAQEDLQISVEELETANEELQATNEEMMSVNEELQSANEELETSKEELQAMNEELSTVNNQLKDKVEQLAELNADLENFVASTGIATLLLDSKRQIGRFTPPTKCLFNLIDTDTGRPIGDIRQKFDDQNFLQDVDRVFEKFQPVEREIVGEDNATYLMRIVPYRSSEQRPGGVVVTFVDISRRLENERKLRESEARFRNLVENAPDPLIMVDAAGEIILTNAVAQHFFGYSKQELLGMNVDGLIPSMLRRRHKTHRKKISKNRRFVRWVPSWICEPCSRMERKCQLK
ncbi:chemotaxis protein CheB [Parasphingorhabdus sp.]|uniref:chemotaxis protein CheB n=1 Tax=Parasphingorhabdus sp. TaxID=2709688 RepID=UPI0032EB9A64